MQADRQTDIQKKNEHKGTHAYIATILLELKSDFIYMVTFPTNHIYKKKTYFT